MINYFYTDKSTSVHLACQAVTMEHSLVIQQICLLTDLFENTIKDYSEKQLLFLRACLILQHHLEDGSVSSFGQYKLFLVEERLKKYTM